MTDTNLGLKVFNRDELGIDLYNKLIKKNNDETLYEFGRFFLKNKETVSIVNPEDLFIFFNLGGELIEDYLEVFGDDMDTDIKVALELGTSSPKRFRSIIEESPSNEFWLRISELVGLTPFGVYGMIRNADHNVILKGDQRPDAPVGVLASQSSIIFIQEDYELEFQPVILNSNRISWKFRSGIIYGQRRLVNIKAPEVLWEDLDSKADIEKIIEAEVD